ncbi:MAG: hypothetical protein UY51_C0004G0001 [Candidatus Jorgensenbacteria bacterium GW2011_GWB1_49_9]|nr:MAG: hypothetical protein UY51_C0004G0001 [Candidatus Jorgensenbacteria bacterium GW2011_GWB1_49_9]
MRKDSPVSEKIKDRGSLRSGATRLCAEKALSTKKEKSPANRPGIFCLCSFCTRRSKGGRGNQFDSLMPRNSNSIP